MESICELLGIEYPVLAFSHCRDVVAAVSKAGGMGVLGAVTYTPDELEVELKWIEEQVGGKPYGIDVLIPASIEGLGDLDPSTLEGIDVKQLLPEPQRHFLDDLLARHGVPAAQDQGQEHGRRRPGLGGLVLPTTLAEVALEHPIGLVASALGPPPAKLVTAAHERGVQVAALVGTKEHALRQRDAGVDIVVAQGTEAGGHTGEIGTMVLVPEVVKAVAPLPVLAAGGIASGRQMAAAMALGAQGVWTGSVWLTTEEAETNPVVKEKLLAASSRDTVRSKSRTGKPARQLRSAWTDAWESPESPGALPMPLQPLLVEDAVRRIDRAAVAGNPGAKELANYFVGQVVGSLESVRPARQVLLDMVQEYVETVAELASSLGGD
ncbi:MAG: NAD(P)H-dependent flavin oxidoreductase [Acidimicrobiales bacterium]|jgi:NAD(P)H-dependent flavin oxidoreductase YrpB (nitropropane dioxygenase family)|nr:nitronate monooxygenase family protein [Actinomycetota bacterium]